MCTDSSLLQSKLLITVCLKECVVVASEGGTLASARAVKRAVSPLEIPLQLVKIL